MPENDITKASCRKRTRHSSDEVAPSEHVLLERARKSCRKRTRHSLGEVIRSELEVLRQREVDGPVQREWQELLRDQRSALWRVRWALRRYQGRAVRRYQGRWLRREQRALRREERVLEKLVEKLQRKEKCQAWKLAQKRRDIQDKEWRWSCEKMRLKDELKRTQSCKASVSKELNTLLALLNPCSRVMTSQEEVLPETILCQQCKSQIEAEIDAIM